MLLLIVLWLCIGIVVGFIASLAHVLPASWQTRSKFRLQMLGLGAVSAFCGGWLGILLFGRPFTVVMSLWIAVLGVICIPWLTTLKKATLSA
jgi:hypothetical protein